MPYCIFFLQTNGTVGEFCLTEVFLTQVVFAVDNNGIGKFVYDKLLVNVIV